MAAIPCADALDLDAFLGGQADVIAPLGLHRGENRLLAPREIDDDGIGRLDIRDGLEKWFSKDKFNGIVRRFFGGIAVFRIA